MKRSYDWLKNKLSTAVQPTRVTRLLYSHWGYCGALVAWRLLPAPTDRPPTAAVVSCDNVHSIIHVRVCLMSGCFFNFHLWPLLMYTSIILMKRFMIIIFLFFTSKNYIYNVKCLCPWLRQCLQSLSIFSCSPKKPNQNGQIYYFYDILKRRTTMHCTTV